MLLYNYNDDNIHVYLLHKNNTFKIAYERDKWICRKLKTETFDEMIEKLKSKFDPEKLNKIYFHK